MTQVTETQKREEERFEFSFYVNDNIICQRFFKIRDFDEKFAPLDENSAKNYKSNSKKELGKVEILKELANSITGDNYGIIPNYLKGKSINYLWENYKPYYTQNDETYKSSPKKGDMFQFEISIDKTVVLRSEFPNDYFTLNPKINVDIREVIQEIMTEIRHSMSVKNYSKTAN